MSDVARALQGGVGGDTRHAPAVTLRACGVQLDPRIGEPQPNAVAVAAEILTAAEEGAELVVFPEAALTGYVFESAEEARAAAVRADGAEVESVAAACREAGVFAVVGAVEREGGGLYNAAFLIGPDGLVGRYRKVHTLCLGVDRFAHPGPDPFRVWDLPFGRLGVNICYDGSFPESGRILRLLGAQLIVLPTNWPHQRLKRELVRVRAYENHVNYFAVNRVGVERGVRFDGGSVAAGPLGELLAEGGVAAGRVHVEFDLAAAAATRVVEAPGEYEYDRIADRRPEMYGPLSAPMDGAEKTGSRQAGG